jgi:adenosylcobinamide-phosphate synthase
MLIVEGAPILLLLALALDAVIGDPDWLWRRVPHPVVLMGAMTTWLDRRLNKGSDPVWKRRAGVIATGLLVGVAGGTGYLLHSLFAQDPAGLIGEVIIAAILLAQLSLYEHVERVYWSFRYGGLMAARRAVSKIVGRDPNVLDEAGVCRATIETMAENFSDGVVAPAFWFLVGGLPGIMIYKAVNTADSMIGYKTPQYREFGWAAARLDDWLNHIPARLSGAFLVAGAALAGGNRREAWQAMLRDARLHRSPNAGWPEAAAAGALGIAVAGPRQYLTGPVYDAWMNEGGRTDVRRDDISRALKLLIAACSVQAAAIAAVGVASALL